MAVGVVTAAGLAASACVSSTVDPAPSNGPAPGYPVTIANCGKEYTYTRTPGRVVIMDGGSVGEVSSLLALGVGDRIVANAQSYGVSDEPGRAEAIAKLPTGDIRRGDGSDIPREAMLALRPDLVISTWGGGFDPAGGYASRDELAAIGANTYVPGAYCATQASVISEEFTVESSYAMLRDLGAIFGVGDRAERLIDQSRRRIADVTARVAGRRAPPVMLAFPGIGTEMSVGASGIWNDVITKAGGTNPFAATTKELFARPSVEQLAAAQIAAVVVLTYQSRNPEADARALFDRFPHWDASQAKRYVVLSDSVYIGPDNATAVERIARVIHPEAF